MQVVGLSRMDATRRILQRGALQDTGRVLGGGVDENGNPKNVNGALRVLEATFDGTTLQALEKPAAAQAVQDVGFIDASSFFGTARSMPAGVIRDGVALIELVPGVTAGAAHVRSIQALDAAMANTYLNEGVPRSVAYRNGVRDRELLGAQDFTFTNDDRHPANLMVAPPRVSGVDNGSIGNGEMPDPLVPRLGPWYQPGGTEVGLARLGADSLAVVRGIDPAGVDRMLDGFVRAARDPRNADNNLLRGVASDEYRSRVHLRLAHLQETGSYEWTSSLSSPRAFVLGAPPER